MSSNAGAIAGGVIGDVSCLVLLSAALWFSLRCHRQSHKQASPPVNPLPPSYSKPRLDVHGHPVFEVEDTGRFEMQG